MRAVPARVAIVYFAVFVTALLIAALGALTFGVPVPRVHDEFSYLFAAETFARFRLTNPAPPVPDAFFSPHILVEPTFASKYPPAQGLVLAAGVLLGLPIFGVWLSGALAATALLWCARARMTLTYALVPTIAFMVTTLFAGRWISTYWGGFVPFAGGALVIGFSLRLRSGVPRTSAFVCLGGGLALLALSRPFEGLVLCLALVLAYGDEAYKAVGAVSVRVAAGRLAVAGALVTLALVFQVALNSAVTGSPTRLPHLEFHERYMSIPLFIWEAPRQPVSPDARLLEVESDFEIGRTWPGHLLLLARFLAGSLVDLVGVLVSAILVSTLVEARRHRRIVAVALVVPLLQSAASYMHFAHYFAPVAPTWFVVAGLAVARLFGTRHPASPIPALATVPVCVLSALPIWIDGPVASVGPRGLVLDRFASHHRVIVFVEYDPGLWPHINVVYNDPDLRDDVLLVNHMDEARNCELIRAFPGRSVARVRLGPAPDAIHEMAPDWACPDPAAPGWPADSAT